MADCKVWQHCTQKTHKFIPVVEMDSIHIVQQCICHGQEISPILRHVTIFYLNDLIEQIG